MLAAALRPVPRREGDCHLPAIGAGDGDVVRCPRRLHRRARSASAPRPLRPRPRSGPPAASPVPGRWPAGSGCRTARRTETSQRRRFEVRRPRHRAPLGSLLPSVHSPLSTRRIPSQAACGRGKLCQVPPAPGLPSDVRSCRGASLNRRRRRAPLATHRLEPEQPS